MLYDKSIDAFRKTCETRSFTRAAEELYISHTALIKQINKLEKELGVSLFNRTSHGVSPTEAGSVFYEKTTDLLSMSVEIVEQTRKVGVKKKSVIRVGVSLFYPAGMFLELWHSLPGLSSLFDLQIVQIPDDAKRYAGLGSQYDILVGPYNLELSYPFYPIGSYPFSIAMPFDHPLKDKNSIHFSDLDGNTIMIMKEGTSPINDNVRKKIQEVCYYITIIDIAPQYDMHTFNRCAESHCLLLSLSCWDNVHPGLVSRPLDEPYALPCGVVTSLHVSKDMETFIHYLQFSIKKLISLIINREE